MEKKKWFVLVGGLLFLGFSLLLPVQSVFADVIPADENTLWTKIDGEVDVTDILASLSMGGLTGDQEFGLFCGDQTLTLLNSSSLTTVQINFASTGTGWTISAGSDSLTIEGDLAWGFYFGDTAGTYSYNYEQQGKTDTFYLTCDGFEDVTISVVDVEVVSSKLPVPTTMLLLGSGLMGMAGFTRRKRG